jgi:UDP-N-acetylmuramate--alanine ligase
VLEVITNIDLEHLDYYRDIDHIKTSFLQFIDKIPFYGAAIICLDDQNVADIMPEIRRRVITYGLTGQSDLYAEQISFAQGRVRFIVKRAEQTLGEINLAPPGIHNVYNALATICVGLELEISFQVIADALASFAGVQRRMQHKGMASGITVVDDYGHHPTEIRATLSAIKEAWPEKRLVVLFQPHRYSRTKGLFKEFQTCFHKADLLVMTDIYAASEKPIEGVSSELLMNKIQQHGQRYTAYVPDLQTLAEQVRPMLQPGDLVLSLGAGNIVKAGEDLLSILQQERS